MVQAVSNIPHLGVQIACYLVSPDRLFQITVAFRILVIRPDKDPLLTSWHGKGANAGHDIRNDLSRLELAHQSLVLRVELAVPVYLGVVELEDAAGLADLDVQVIGSREDLVGESSKLIVRANIIDLVDDGPEVRVLV